MGGLGQGGGMGVRKISRRIHEKGEICFRLLCNLEAAPTPRELHTAWGINQSIKIQQCHRVAPRRHIGGGVKGRAGGHMVYM